jgi:hypothetical protein
LARSLLNRLEALQKIPPRGVTFFLEDGTKYWHPGPPLDMLTAIMAQMEVGNRRILSILRKTVGASNCGLLWEIPKALDRGVDSQPAEVGMKVAKGKNGEMESKRLGKNGQRKNRRKTQ